MGTELAGDPRALAALTTHGRTAWAEAILGGMTLRVIRDSKRPVIVFRPPEDKRDVPEKISTVAVALDGGDFSEKMVRHAVKAAQFLSARLLLLCKRCPSSLNDRRRRTTQNPTWWNHPIFTAKQRISKTPTASNRNGKCCTVNRRMRSDVILTTCPRRCWR